MLATDTYESLIDKLTIAFKERYPKQSKSQVCGLLFARPTSSFVKKEILPNVEYFDRNSANHIDFFCIGYKSFLFEENFPPNCEIICQNMDSNWSFSIENFLIFKNGMESDNHWHYSGACDLLLLNAVFNSQEGTAELDFGTVIPIDLEIAIEEKAIRSVERLFESIVRLTKSLSGDNPTAALSNKLAVDLGKQDAVRVVSKLLPYGIGDVLGKYAHFATK